MQLRRRLPVLLTSVLLMMLSLGTLLTLHLATEMRENRAMVRNAFEVSDTVRSLLLAVQNAETGQRGFIMTGRQSYLAPYDQALRDLPEIQDRLATLVAADMPQTTRLDRLLAAVQAKLGELQETLEVARSQGQAAALERVQTDRGRDLMQTVRGEVATILAAQETSLDHRIAAADARQDRNYALALLGGAVALIVIVVGALLLFRNLARLRRAEAGLARQGAVLQATLDSIQDGVVAFDAVGRLVARNDRFFTQLDFPLALAAPGTPLAALQAIEAGRAVPVLAQAPPFRQSGTAPANPEPLLVLQSGRQLEVSRSAMAGGGFVVSCIDVTRRAQAEAILRQAQKMEVIGQLTGGVAHDFNNLLQVVSGNLDLLERALGPAGAPEVTLGEAPRRHLRHALNGVERGARLTGQLLAFARRQPLEPKVINPGAQVRDMTELLRRTLGERVAVEAVLGGGLWNTQVDPTQLGNALLNLAVNARDAMPEGGRLTIEVSNAALDDSYAAGQAEVEPGQYVMLAVTDSGTGMPPEIMTRVFEPFFTTKPEGQGTGLGLSQVYGFVKQSGGHVALYSEPGEGTSVKLYLPRSRKPEEALGHDPGTAVEGGTETVLVVEDDAGVRGAVVDMLTELGYRVLRAEHAEAALTVLSSGARVDLMFTDVVMPGPIRTPELARRAQALIPGLKVLYTSGYTANAIIHDGRLDADVLLLSKPYRRDDLARQVRRALGPPAPAAATEAVPAAVAPAALAPVETAPVETTPVETAPVEMAPVETVPVALAADRGSPLPARQGWPAGSLVLVVEDDALIRMSLAQMIEAMGLTVIDVGSAEEALPLLRQSPPTVLVTDLGLPGMDGVALVQAARQLDPGLAVLLASGQPLGSVVMPAALRASSGFLGKPFGMRQLEQALVALWRDDPRRTDRET